ncbi:MAG TPA: LCP family protein [Anaerolineales bacterium]|nr:LCP family protein [Anaerolineales bacterium]HMR98971.1 LCP family protein [Anaerolineales bacterium]HNQ94408.1 LCP family protein [Anaerolineales bacterium]HNS61280.1 LCP family protein [Anaerolineales bacterium]
MTRAQKTAFTLLSIFAILLSGAVYSLYTKKWRAPLGPSLQLPTWTPFALPATWTPDPRATKTPLSAITVDSAKPTTTQPPQCGATPVMHILLIGSDARADSYNYGLADVIRLARVDFMNETVTVLEFPRDLWVEIPDIADNLDGQTHEKLNQAYLYGNPGFQYTNDPAQGPGLLARTLALNFGARIDHYAAINMKTFVNIVNAVGGIDVYLPEPVDGRAGEDLSERLVFPAGQLHLMGDRALTLARIRIEGGFARAENQNRVLCALRDQLTSPEVVKDIPELIQAFRDNVQTDLSPAQISDLACLGTQIQTGDIRFVDFPQSLFVQTREFDPVFGKNVSILKTDFEILREYVHQFNEGAWQATSAPVGTPGEEVPFCP